MYDTFIRKRLDFFQILIKKNYYEEIHGLIETVQ